MATIARGAIAQVSETGGARFGRYPRNGLGVFGSGLRTALAVAAISLTSALAGSYWRPGAVDFGVGFVSALTNAGLIITAAIIGAQ